VSYPDCVRKCQKTWAQRDSTKKRSKFGLGESKAQNENNITSNHMNISLCLNYRFLSRPANAFVTIPYVAKKRPGYISYHVKEIPP
jgi:hypothetical protein